METPWGPSDFQSTLAEGITFHSTPSHGGIQLSKERQEKIADYLAARDITNFLNNLEWWEEDCDWAIPYVFFAADIEKAHSEPERFDSNLNAAKATVTHWHPNF